MPTTLDLDRIEPLDPEKAVIDRNVASFRSVLEKGWSPRRLKMRDGAGTQDLTLPLKIITGGWDEGWDAMRHHFPDLAKNTALWEVALQYARPHIVADMVAHGVDLNERSHSGMSPYHRVIGALGESGSMPWGSIEALGLRGEDDERRVLDTIETLRVARVDVSEPHPGEFVQGDLGPGGHTLWTRGVAHRRWEVVEAAFPATWDDVLAQPRALEAAAYLRTSAHHGEATAKIQWRRWLHQFLEPWLGTPPHELDQPDDWPFILELPISLRALVWRRWATPSSDGWSGVHQMALQAGEPATHDLLKQMVADEAVCLRLWDTPDASGVTPSHLWVLAVREVTRTAASPDEKWTLQQALDRGLSVE